MSVELDQQTQESLELALAYKIALEEIEGEHRKARVRFIRDAKAAGWSWARMGRALGITDAAVRRFWRDNRMQASRLGGPNENQAPPPEAAAAAPDRAASAAGV